MKRHDRIKEAMSQRNPQLTEAERDFCRHYRFNPAKDKVLVLMPRPGPDGKDIAVKDKDQTIAAELKRRGICGRILTFKMATE